MKLLLPRDEDFPTGTPSGEPQSPGPEQDLSNFITY